MKETSIFLLKGEILMKFVKVDVVPKRRHGRHDLQGLLGVFMNSGNKIVKVDFNDRDYALPNVCANCIRVAIKRLGYPIKVMQRDKEVYLVKV